MFNRSRIPSLVRRLTSSDLDVRLAAAKKLDEIGRNGLSNKKEAIDALNAAADDYPPLTHDWQSASATLVRAAAGRPVEQLVFVIASNFPRFPAEAKMEAFVLLSDIDAAASANLYADLAVQEAREQGVSGLISRPLA